MSGGTVTQVGIAVIFGLIVMSMIYSTGGVSGAHINPAVTIAFRFSKRFDGKEVVPYILNRSVGALLASALVRVMFLEHSKLGATVPSGSWWQSFVFEIVLTFILTFVILNVSTGSKEKGTMAGAAMGSLAALEALFAGPICGASMNPARSLAPAVFSGQISPLWIDRAAPVIGALSAVLGCRCVQQGACGSLAEAPSEETA